MWATVCRTGRISKAVAVEAADWCQLPGEACRMSARPADAVAAMAPRTSIALKWALITLQEGGR